MIVVQFHLFLFCDLASNISETDERHLIFEIMLQSKLKKIDTYDEFWDIFDIRKLGYMKLSRLAIPI